MNDMLRGSSIRELKSEDLMLLYGQIEHELPDDDRAYNQADLQRLTELDLIKTELEARRNL